MQSTTSSARWLCLPMLLALAGTLAPTIVFAQSPPRNSPQATPPEATQPSDPPRSPLRLPKSPKETDRGLDFLFGALKAAPDEESARHVEARILALWSQTSSNTISLLMQRVKTATDAKQSDVALKLLDAVLKLRPEYIEGWSQRATLHYMRNDYQRSLEDVEQVLIREPRHFGALAGLGVIMQELGDDKRALDAFRKALAVNPHLERVRELVKTLTEKVDGRDI